MRRALVTGGSGGIGAATALGLAAAGADVWVTFSESRPGADAIVQACRSNGVEARASRLQLDDPASIAALASEIGAAWGDLHVVVSNAATCPYTQWEEISLEEWDAVMKVNVRGPFLLIKEMLPLLRAAEGDRSIVTLASLAGESGALSTSIHYAASKGAMMGMTRTFARLLAGEGIRCNSVSPGPIDTPMTSHMDPAKRAGMPSAIPLGRMGQAEEVAGTICLLASPGASFTTGATYDVNGGLLIA